MSRQKLLEGAREFYTKFDRGKIIFVSAGKTRLITLRNLVSIVGAGKKDCMYGYVRVSEIVEMNQAGELDGNELIHVTVFSENFKDKALEVQKSMGMVGAHIPDSLPLSEVSRRGGSSL